MYTYKIFLILNLIPNFNLYVRKYNWLKARYYHYDFANPHQVRLAIHRRRKHISSEMF